MCEIKRNLKSAMLWMVRDSGIRVAARSLLALAIAIFFIVTVSLPT